MHSNSSSGSRPSLNSLSSKLPFQALALGIVIMPFNSLNAEKSHQYNTVVTPNLLTVVAVENPTTVFKDGQFLHGFGYDLARSYSGLPDHHSLPRKKPVVCSQLWQALLWSWLGWPCLG